MSASPIEKMKEAKIFFVMGGPGSGKATQCRQMVAKYGLTHLSSGDLLRSQVALGTEGGRRLSRIMAQGELVPLADIVHLLKDAVLARILDSPGFLIEGYPRDIEQAEKFEADLTPVQGVIYLDVPEDVMQQRLLCRGRDIDNPETIKTKLKLYLERTYPVIDYYRKRGLLIKISGQGAADEVFVRIQHGLMKFKGRSNFGNRSAERGKSPAGLLTKPSHLHKTDSHVVKKTSTNSKDLRPSNATVTTTTTMSESKLDPTEAGFNVGLDINGRTRKPSDKKYHHHHHDYHQDHVEANPDPGHSGHRSTENRNSPIHQKDHSTKHS